MDHSSTSCDIRIIELTGQIGKYRLNLSVIKRSEIIQKRDMKNGIGDTLVQIKFVFKENPKRNH